MKTSFAIAGPPSRWAVAFPSCQNDVAVIHAAVVDDGENVFIIGILLCIGQGGELMTPAKYLNCIHGICVRVK